MFNEREQMFFQELMELLEKWNVSLNAERKPGVAYFDRNEFQEAHKLSFKGDDIRIDLEKVHLKDLTARNAVVDKW